MAEFKKFFTANWDSILKPTVVLLSICIIITLALSGTYMLTSKKTGSLADKKQKESMARVLKAEDYTKSTLKSGDKKITYYVAKNSKKAVGYIFITSAKGYGGDVSVMTAVNPDGTVKGVDILDVSKETPGLGQNAAEKNFYEQYSSLKENITVVKNGANPENNEIKAITGATITSRGVTNAINEALSYFGQIGTSGKEAASGGK